MLYDLIIIGAGPAGITASVYAARKRLNFLVITKDIGGQTAWSGDVENYTGYQFITGPDLAAKFEEHMRRYNIEVKEGEGVVEIKRVDKTISVKTDKGGAYEAKTAIIASGKFSRELGVPGEREYKNRGLSYCATCDAPIFVGKDVAVIGGGNSALDACLQLMKIERHVHLININPRLGGDAVMREKVEKSDMVTVMNDTHVMAVVGDKLVTGIKVKKDDKEELIPLQGVFVEIGLIPNSDFSKDVAKNQFKEIIINGKNETNMPGIFAAGDVTDVPEKQIVIAAGEGSKAALSAFKFLNQMR
ncbi:MAG: FAD-dependent oxidoreductase [Candidatus Omnitrophica bacterium]|nr:FAD-dependent oxidoreductase [Candidatus Omnitrophota bacterium]